MPASIERATLDVIERVRLRIAHEKAGHAEDAKMCVHRRVLRRAFLSFEPSAHDQAAARWVGIGQPHAERARVVRERRCISITAVDDLERGNLTIGKTRGRSRIGGVWIDVARAAFRLPGIALPRSLT